MAAAALVRVECGAAFGASGGSDAGGQVAVARETAIGARAMRALDVDAWRLVLACGELECVAGFP